MTRQSEQNFQRVKDFDSLVGYLRTELGWPIVANDLEDATFDWEPEELGIPRDRIPHFRRLRELRPLASGQPWGVFFIEFDGPRLPITPLKPLKSIPCWDTHELINLFHDRRPGEHPRWPRR